MAQGRGKRATAHRHRSGQTSKQGGSRHRQTLFPKAYRDFGERQRSTVTQSYAHTGATQTFWP